MAILHRTHANFVALLKGIATSNIQINAGTVANSFFSSAEEATKKMASLASLVLIVTSIAPTITGQEGNTWRTWRIAFKVLKKHEKEDYAGIDANVSQCLEIANDILSWLIHHRLNQSSDTFDFDENTFQAREDRVAFDAHSGCEISLIISTSTFTNFDAAKWQ